MAAATGPKFDITIPCYHCKERSQTALLCCEKCKSVFYCKIECFNADKALHDQTCRADKPHKASDILNGVAQVLDPKSVSTDNNPSRTYHILTYDVGTKKILNGKSASVHPIHLQHPNTASEYETDGSTLVPVSTPSFKYLTARVASAVANQIIVVTRASNAGLYEFTDLFIFRVFPHNTST